METISRMLVKLKSMWCSKIKVLILIFDNDLWTPLNLSGPHPTYQYINDQDRWHWLLNFQLTWWWTQQIFSVNLSSVLSFEIDFLSLCCQKRWLEICTCTYSEPKEILAIVFHVLSVRCVIGSLVSVSLMDKYVSDKQNMSSGENLDTKDIDPILIRGSGNCFLLPILGILPVRLLC